MSSAVPHAAVARQPILTETGEVHAYELLFRDPDAPEDAAWNGDRATAKVLLDTTVDLGLDRVAGDLPIFVNFTRAFLVGDYALPLPPWRVVIEVLEDVEPDEEVLAGIRRLKKVGYRIALDDFEFHPALAPLLDLADLVKLDVLALGIEGTARQVRLLAEWGLPLLAEKVETRDEFDACRALGFEWFQGWYFARPRLVSGRRMAPEALGAARLMRKILDPRVEPRALARLVRGDVGLTTRLLRLVNSAAYARARRVDSVQQAVLQIGMQRLRSWLALFALQGFRGHPDELQRTALRRARMCEMLGEGQAGAEELFLVGLLSVADVLLDRKMPAATKALGLSDRMRAALVRHEGPVGETLAAVLAHEAADWKHPAMARFSTAELNRAFVQALSQAEAAWALAA